MKSYIVYCSLCDRKQAPAYKTTMHQLVETLVSHCTKVLSEQKLHKKIVQVDNKYLETCIFFIRINIFESSVKIGKQ